MASNREERLQMRQRGAGTRKIQAVDFGFSFGSPPPDSQSGPAALEVTNRIDSVVADAVLLNVTSPVNDAVTIEKTTPTVRSPRASNSIAQPARSSVRRSINGTTAILNATNEQAEVRSSKRRRISTENDNVTASASISSPPPVANKSPSNPQNFITNAEIAEAAGNIQIEHQVDPSQEVVRPNNRRGGAKTLNSQTRSKARTSQANEQAKNRPSRRQSGVNGSNPSREDAIKEAQSQASKKTKSTRGLEKQPTEDIEEDEDTNQLDIRSGKRKQIENDKRTTFEGEQAEESNEQPRQPSRGGRKSLGRLRRNAQPEPEDTDEESTAAQTTRKRKGNQRATEAGVDTAEVEDRDEVAQPSEQSQARKKPRQSLQTGAGTRRRGRQPLVTEADQQAPGPEAGTEAEAEADTADSQPVTSTRAGQATKRRGRASGATDRQTRARRRSVEEESGEPSKRHIGTVSITVHRLANAEALDSVPADASDNEDDSSDERQEQEQEEQAVGKRFPSRSGANVADVLAQICKEILDKHLASLDNSITNDTSTTQSKRAEYVRQHKAVEAYGTQLEGRLFELSELLDSNFTLGVQLKKAKREAAEMRNRLLAVRQRRHELTLRMDTVRQKHGEEENAKMSRNAINNALHNLEMTLDRSRLRADESHEHGQIDSTGIAGLEFLLRSVSESVSSAAEGSQGGLLSQVKAFNAQLEGAAKKLERSS